MQTDVIRRITIQSQVVGDSDARQKVAQLDQSVSGFSETTGRAARAVLTFQDALARQQQTIAISLRQSQQFQAANDNVAQSSSHLGDALRIATKATIEHAASWLSTIGAVGAGLLVLGGVLGVLGPIILAYKLVKDAINLASEAWELSGQKLEEYRAIAEKAAAVDLSTSYFQKLAKGAEDSKIPVDQLTEALKNLQKTSQDQLGGSALDKILGQHEDAGNFNNNSGLDLFQQANTTEQKFKAIVELIHQAMQDGQRLAAIDIANSAFGPQAADNLRKDSEYFDKILASANEIKDTQIISDADIGRALEMKNRWDESVKILETRWHPIQDLLTAGGIRLREIWVDIVYAIAQAVDQVFKLVAKIGDIPQSFLDFAKTGVKAGASLAAGALAGPIAGPLAGAAVGYATGLGSNDSNAAKSTDAYADAVTRLKAGLQNQNAVQQAVNQTTTIANKVLGDNSQLIDQTVKSTQASSDAVDRAINSLQKHVLQQQADAQAVGLGAAAQARFRAEAAETAAIQANGGKITAEQSAEFDRLKIAAGEAAEALAKANVASQIDFAKKTAFLSPADVQIASQLKEIYGNDIPAAMASSEAAAIRVNNAIKDAHDYGLQFAQTFVQGLLQGKSAMDSLRNAAEQLATKLADKALVDLFSGNFLQAGIEGIAAIGAALFGSSKKDNQAQQQAAQELKQAQDAWHGMTEQLVAFNQAAAGTTFGTLTNDIIQLQKSLSDLSLAAEKAQNFAAVPALQNTFNEGVSRVVKEFVDGAPVLTDLQQKMAAVSNEGQGLISTLSGMGLATAAGIQQIQAAITQQQASLKQAFISSTENGLVADVRNNSGVGYLNTITDAIQKFNDLAAQGVNPNVLWVWLISTAQTAVNSAQLTGQAFQDLIAQFPQLTNVVHEFIDTTALAAKASADATEKVNLQLRLLTATTDTSTQAGALTLFDAKAKQERDAAIAGGISPANLLLLDQALAAERLGVIKTFTDQAISAEKQLADARLAQMQRIQQYLDNLAGGSSSTLSPSDRLAAAQSQFSSQLSAARGGDQNAISNITSYSDNLLQAARAYYGSAVGYQSILAQVQNSLSGLIGTGLVGSVASSGLPTTTPSASGVPGGSTSISTPVAANSNSAVDAINALRSEVSALKSALSAKFDENTSETKKTNAVLAAASSEEDGRLDKIANNTAVLVSQGNLALAAPR